MPRPCGQAAHSSATDGVGSDCNERRYLRGGGAARQRRTLLQPWTAGRGEERTEESGGARVEGRGGLKSG